MLGKTVFQGWVAFHPAHGFRSATFRAGKTNQDRAWFALISQYSASGFRFEDIRKINRAEEKQVQDDYKTAGWSVVPVSFNRGEGAWLEDLRAAKRGGPKEMAQERVGAEPV